MIKLNALEIKLFGTLRDFLKAKQLDSTLRVAGGWVRDKLLNKESTDIDIALDNCSGERFAELFHEYLKGLDLETHGFGVIRKNPEKSKHLETATIQVFDSWIDFVNLRGEEYGEDSRIPNIVIGTPESDAFRRDFTVNALFYNINDGKIEDFTKMGLADLENGLLRTPLNPLKTFMDDPLRILRGFRFSVRFSFALDPRIFEAIAQPQVKESFVKKISRERIGIEFTANFQKNPSLARAFDFYGLIHTTALWPLILCVPASPVLDKGFADMSRVAAQLDSLLPKFQYINQHYGEKDPTRKFFDWEYFQVALLSSFTMAFFDRKVKDPKKLFVYGLFANSLKLPNRYGDMAAHIQRSVAQLGDYARAGEVQAEDLAMWQRDSGAFWRLCEQLHNTIYEQDIQQGKAKKLELEKQFKERGLENFWDVKPLLDGKEIGHLFGVSGPEIKARQTQMLRWQSRNPEGTKDDFFKASKKV